MPQALPAALAIGAGAAAGGLIQKIVAPAKQVAAQVAPLPQAPAPEDAGDKAEAMAKKRRIANTQTVYSSPLGISGQADVARKTLTGQ